MTAITALPSRAPTAMVQIGRHQVVIELPGQLRVGDPDYTAQLGKAIAAGLEDAFQTWPPKASA